MRVTRGGRGYFNVSGRKVAMSDFILGVQRLHETAGEHR